MKPRSLISKVFIGCAVGMVLSLPVQFLHAAPPQRYVIGWGVNQGGQATGIPSVRFTNGTFVMTDMANQCATGAVMIVDQVLSNALAISAGAGHSLALRSDGTVVGWGGNGRGIALGYETPYPFRTNGVVRIDGQILSNVVSIVAGRTFSLALRKDSTIVAWGDRKRIEDISPLDVEKAAGRQIGAEIVGKLDPRTGLLLPQKDNETKNHLGIGITHNGMVVTRLGSQEPTSLSNIVAIAAVGYASLAVKSDGTVVEWDEMSVLSPLLLPVPELSNVIAVAMGDGYQGPRIFALKRDGTVAHWGGESIYNDATPPSGLSNVVAITAGSSHTLALKSDGTVIGWGFNGVGQATGVPTTNSPYMSAEPVRIGGQVLSNVVSIAAGRDYSMALKKDGTVTTWGSMENYLYPVSVPAGLSNVVAIAAGDNFCLAITTNRAVADKFRQN